MAKVIEAFKRRVMSISYQERRKSELLHYKEELARLSNMEIDEINLEYRNMKSEYERKKNVLSIFAVSIIISVLMNAWRYFFEFVEKIIQYANIYQESGAEAGKTIFICSALIIVFINVIIFAILIVHIRRMNWIYRRLILIEEVRSKQKD